MLALLNVCGHSVDRLVNHVAIDEFICFDASFGSRPVMFQPCLKLVYGLYDSNIICLMSLAIAPEFSVYMPRLLTLNVVEISAPSMKQSL